MCASFTRFIQINPPKGDSIQVKAICFTSSSESKVAFIHHQTCVFDADAITRALKCRSSDVRHEDKEKTRLYRLKTCSLYEPEGVCARRGLAIGIRSVHFRPGSGNSVKHLYPPRHRLTRLAPFLSLSHFIFLSLLSFPTISLTRD